MFLLISMLIGTLVVTASDQASLEPDLAGLYICDGVNHDGSSYRGIVQIVKHQDAYQLLWSFESEVVAIGIGIRSGNVLAVMNHSYSGVPGVIAYRDRAWVSPCRRVDGRRRRRRSVFRDAD